jgi:NADH dehydrogenase [ubiquinone] 1 alpha subcomplex assembly factor 7
MTALGDLLARRIASDGPMTVGTFMAACLTHPAYGYYVTRDPLGRSGDFTTAPEISQMFGELIGAWSVVAWETMGKPSPFFLVELGPGRGTLMADALRAVRGQKDFLSAVRVHLVEASPTLRAEQEKTLGAHNPTWLDDLTELPPGPTILIANEFFDALPIEQFVLRADGWHRRLVALDDNGRLTLSQSKETVRLDVLLEGASDGAIVEMSPAGQAVAFEIGSRFRDHPGHALILDFGRMGNIGESLQALRGHAAEPMLANPSEADLAAHVDFAALAKAISISGAHAFGPVPQGEFLKALGIEARAQTLAQTQPDKAGELALALSRLTGSRAMGRVFQAMALVSPTYGAPPGFDGATRLSAVAMAQEDDE